MKKSIYLLLLASLTTLTCLAQAPKFKFGSVSIDELQKSKYEIDSTADAIILYEKANVNFGYDDAVGFYIESVVTARKKILKASALNKGIINIEYARPGGKNDEIINSIDGNTYNLENGGMVKSNLSKKSIFEEKITDNYYTKKISLPNVKEGSIIEYTYYRRTPFNVKDKPMSWTFQNEEPTLWSQYDVVVPNHFYYKIIMGGYLPLTLNSNVKENVTFDYSPLDTFGSHYTFAVKDAPAFKDEPYITTPSDYVSKIEFELASVSLPNQPFKEYSLTWENLDKTLNESESFGRRLKKSNYLKEVIQNFAGVTDKKEKLEKLYTYFNTNFEADLDKNYIWSSDLKKVFENKKGTATELNLMFVSLLRELDYDANPIVLSTRDHGKLNQAFALIDKLNYAIVQVNLDGQSYTLDVSSPFLKFGMLPIRCLNEIGRLIKANGTGEFAYLKPVEKLKEFTNIEAKIDQKTGDLIGSYLNSGTGYYSYLTRIDYKDEGEQKFIENLKKENDDWDFTNLALENFKDPESVASIKYNFKKKNEDEEIAEIIYIEPILTNKTSSNPFKSESREYPIDFGYAQDEIYKLILEIPEFYEVTSLPKNLNLKMENEAGMFTYASNFDANTKKITIISRINLKNTIYGADQYSHLKEFYSKIVEKHNEQIVLKRTKN